VEHRSIIIIIWRDVNPFQELLSVVLDGGGDYRPPTRDACYESADSLSVYVCIVSSRPHSHLRWRSVGHIRPSGLSLLVICRVALSRWTAAYVQGDARERGVDPSAPFIAQRAERRPFWIAYYCISRGRWLPIHITRVLVIDKVVPVHYRCRISFAHLPRSAWSDKVTAQ